MRRRARPVYTDEPGPWKALAAAVVRQTIEDFNSTSTSTKDAYGVYEPGDTNSMDAEKCLHTEYFAAICPIPINLVLDHLYGVKRQADEKLNTEETQLYPGLKGEEEALRKYMLDFRDRNHITRKKMAKKCGISETLLAIIERGGVTTPKLAHNVAKAYRIKGIMAEYLVPEHMRPHGPDYEPDRYVEPNRIRDWHQPVTKAGRRLSD